MDTSPARCLAVWSAVTATALAVGRWATADLSFSTAPATFDALVQTVAASALVGCALWSWWVTTAVVTPTLLGRCSDHGSSPRGVPRWARRVVLVACGAALVTGVHGAPAHASTGPVTVVDHRAPRGPATDAGPDGVGRAAGDLDGLRLPDRTTGPLRERSRREQPRLDGPDPAAAAGLAAARARAGDTVTVRPGDSLWAIAGRLLGPDAPAADVAALVGRLYALNRTEIGPDADLIQPGALLRTPLGERPAR